MGRLSVPKSDVNKSKTKLLQIRECSINIIKIPANTKTFKGVKILNSDSVKPTIMKMAKEVRNKGSGNKKENPAVVIQEKTTKLAKKEKNITCSVVIENEKNESVHVLRNRVVKTDLKKITPVPLVETSTQNGVSNKRTQKKASVETSVVPELKPTKISARLANRPKSSFVQKKTVPVKPQAKKSRAVHKEVTDSTDQLKENNKQKELTETSLETVKSSFSSNEPQSSFVKSPTYRLKLQQPNDDDMEKKASVETPVVPELKPTKISARLANRPKSSFVQKKTVPVKPQAKKSRAVHKEVTDSTVQLKENNKQKKLTETTMETVKSSFSSNEPQSSFVKSPKSPTYRLKLQLPNDDDMEKKASVETPVVLELEPTKISARLANRPKSSFVQKKTVPAKPQAKKSRAVHKEVTDSTVQLKENNKQKKLTETTMETVKSSFSSNEPQSSFVKSPKSPTYRLKLQLPKDDDMDDIYDFPMSNSMVEKPKATKVNTGGVKKKRIRQIGKAGSKLELLMKKSTMNVVGNSCHVQNNPEIYKMKQIEMNKLIIAQKTRTNSPKPQLRKILKPLSSVENISDEDDVIASDSPSHHVDYPVVVALPTFKSPVNKNLVGLVMNKPNSSSSPFRISDETIFPRTFYMQLGSDTMPSYSSDCINAPDRRTFNVSSESRKSLQDKIPEIYPPTPAETTENDENQTETDENQIEDVENQAKTDVTENAVQMEDDENEENQTEDAENRSVMPVTATNESHETDTSIPINNSCESFLGDSNGENVEPIGHKSPSKAKRHFSALRSPLRSPLKSSRSPLKSLPIPSQSEFGAVSSPLVVFNLTAQQLLSPKKIATFITPISTLKAPEIIVDKLLQSTKSLALVNDSVESEQEDLTESLAIVSDSEQDEPQPSTSKQSDAREHLNFAKKLKDVQKDLGFDELLEESRSGSNPTSSGNNDDADDEIKMHLQNLKKYLPSRQNKDRDREIFATSPVKKTKNLFKSPMIDKLTDIRTAFHASTPVNVLKKQKLLRNIFMNTSKIDSPIEPVENEVSIDQQDESVIEVSNAENSVTGIEEEVDENYVSSNLFNDQSELFLNNTKSYQRKRKFEFLNAPDDPAEDEDEQDEEQQLKRQTKSKKKKPDIEKTREFKDFVLNKSKEFAEVDEYQLIVEKVNKP